MLVHAVSALAAARSVDLVVVAAPADDVAEVEALLDSYGEHAAGRADIVVVSGGATRQESVARALAGLPDDVDVVLVHDAARPLAPIALIDAVATAVRAGADAVVPGIAVADTIKSVDAADWVSQTLDRSVLRAVQTPQGFRRAILVQAHEHADADAPATDDAGLVEAIGGKVAVIPGDEEAFKVTRPLDLLLADAILARRRASGALT